MCDTLVALPEATVDGVMLLAKNADTEVNEAQQILRLLPRSYFPGAALRITHLSIKQAEHTYEVLLDRSFWAWGGEIGCNENGVAIGNEAAFSNQVAEKDGVIALDLLRLALERAGTAEHAVRIIAEHVERYGQGGNVQMMGNYRFDSGFLIADRTEAWVMNCAGYHWAARRARSTDAISNRYQITDDWDIGSLPVEAAKPNFRARFADPQREYEAGADEREQCAVGLLGIKRGYLTMHDMARVLRDVGNEDDYDVTRDDRSIRICMHAGPTPSRFWHATGAMISEVRADSEVVWMTGTSATDLSIFKPLMFGIPLPDAGLQPGGTDGAETLWWRHERLHRRAMADYKAVKQDIRADFDSLEHSFHAESRSVRNAPLSIKTEFVRWCWQTAALHTERWIERLERRPYSVSHPGYRAMWNQFNTEAALAL